MKSSCQASIMIQNVIYFYTLFVFATAMLDSTFFKRDVGFDDRVPEDKPIYEILSIPRPLCALHCLEDRTSLAFAHNLFDGRCSLFSDVNLTQRMGIVQFGNMIFKKSVCETPSIPEGRLLDVVGRGEGSRAYFVCDDYFFPTVLYGLCSGNVWTGLAEPCDYQNILPTTFQPVGGMDSGQCFILLSTTPSADTSTDIRLKSEDNEEGFLQVEFRIDEEIIERKSKVGGIRSEKETYLPYWPLVVGQDVNLTLCIEDKMFRMYIDRVEMFTHNRRPSNHTIAKARFHGFNVKTLIYTDII